MSNLILFNVARKYARYGHQREDMALPPWLMFDRKRQRQFKALEEADRSRACSPGDACEKCPQRLWPKVFCFFRSLNGESMPGAIPRRRLTRRVQSNVCSPLPQMRDFPPYPYMGLPGKFRDEISDSRNCARWRRRSRGKTNRGNWAYTRQMSRSHVE
jgi:hypothetical protein